MFISFLKNFSYMLYFAVKIRVISLDQDMKPSPFPIKLEVRNPQDIIVKQVESVVAETGFITESFHFPPHPLFGNWSVVVHYGHRVSIVIVMLNGSIRNLVVNFCCNWSKMYNTLDIMTMSAHIFWWAVRKIARKNLQVSILSQRPKYLSSAIVPMLTKKRMVYSKCLE